MSDPAPTSAAPAAKSPKKSSAKTKKPADHPPYKTMVIEAIKELKERNGSSRQRIMKYLVAEFKVKKETASKYLRATLKQGVSNGTFEQIKGSFKLSREARDAAKPKKKEKKKVAAKPKPKKPAAKKTVTKKAASKKSKSPAKKSSGKKTTPKKTGGKKTTGTA